MKKIAYQRSVSTLANELISWTWRKLYYFMLTLKDFIILRL